MADEYRAELYRQWHLRRLRAAIEALRKAVEQTERDLAALAYTAEAIDRQNRESRL